jgi:hypothetical protein
MFHNISRFIGALCFVCAIPIVARADACTDAGSAAEQLKCEILEKAGPPGRHPDYGGVRFGHSPEQCTIDTDYYKNVNCSRDRSGNTHCNLAVEYDYECGAGGGGNGVFRCTKVAATGEVFCSKEIYSNDGESLSQAEIDRILSTPPFAGSHNLRTAYWVHVGSSRTELGAYTIGWNVLEKLGGREKTELDVGVEMVTLSDGRWYRVFLGPPASFNEATVLCARIRRAGLDYCVAMKTHWISVRR